jgi:hypothetical protein
VRRGYTSLMMRRVIVSALVLLLPLAAAAQDAPGQDASVLEIRRARESAPRRSVVHPSPPLDEAVRAAERATAEYESMQRADELLREQRSSAANRRPDLDYDVTSGVQQRNLLRLR